ncbi:MAG TPA: hypothetical protein VF070_32710 [Streptosporangiaceae bacterium]
MEAASLVGLRSAWLALGYLMKVFGGEDDPVTVEVEGDLLAVGACPQGALGYLFKPDAAQDLGRLLRSEHMREAYELCDGCWLFPR